VIREQRVEERERLGGSPACGGRCEEQAGDDADSDAMRSMAHVACDYRAAASGLTGVWIVGSRTVNRAPRPSPSLAA